MRKNKEGRKNKLVSVVIVSRDRKKDLVECVDSYLRSSYRPLEIIIVDNASDPPISTWLKRNSKVILITLSKNVGAAQGRNIGLKEAKGEYILFTDDDAYAAPDMVKNLVQVFLDNKDAGVVQPLVYDKQKKNMLQGAGHEISLITGRIKAWGVKEIDKGQYEGVREVPMCGCVWMVKREVFKKIGLYDEAYFIPYEDSDFSIRARKAGFKLFCYSKAKTWHQGRKLTFVHPRLEWLGITAPERAYRLARNKIIFMRKHSPFPANLIFFLVLLPIYIFFQTAVILTALRTDVLWKYWQGIVSGIKYLLFYKTTPRLIAGSLIIILSSYLTLRLSLDFALFGDDWVGLYVIKYNYSRGYQYDFTKLSGIIGPYSVPFHFMAIIDHFWGYNPLPYLFTSFIFRTLMCLGLAYLIYKLTKSVLAATITGVLVAVSPTGLETTNWGAWNMATYLAVFLFSISFWFFITSRKKWKRYLLSVFFLTLSVITFPQRMQIALVFLPFIDFFWFLKDFNRRNFLVWLTRLIVIVLVIVFLDHYHAFGGIGDREYIIQETLKNLKQAKNYFWVNLTTSFANSFIPYDAWTHPTVSTLTGNIIGATIGPRKKLIFLVFSLVTVFIALFLKKSRKKFIITSLILGIAWTYYLKSIFGEPFHTFNSINAIFATFLGGYIMIWIFLGFILNLKSNSFLIYLAFSSWFFIFVSIAWLRSNVAIMPTYLRYMLVPGVWMPLFAGFIFSKINSINKKFLFFLFTLLLGLLNYNFSYSYLKELHTVRNVKLYDKLWGELLEEITDYRPSEDYAVFYFEGPGDLIYNALVFGFPPKIAIIYDISEADAYKLPVFVDTYQNLQKVVIGDDFTKAFAKEPEKLTEDRIYAFSVSHDGIVNITKEAVNHLKSDGLLTR